MAAVDDQSGHGQRGQDPQPDQGVAGGQRGDPGQQRGQRRLVDVAERQVLPGRQEIQLVAHVAVPRADRHLDAERARRDQGDREPWRAGRRCGHRGARPRRAVIGRAARA